MMQALIIGDAGSIFIKEYIEYVLLPMKYKIVLLQEGVVNHQYLDFYAQNGIVLEKLVIPRNKYVFKIPGIRSSLGVKIWCNYIVQKYGRFDLVHIHGVNNSRGNIAKCMRKYCTRLIVTIWGDELLRKDENTLSRYTGYYEIADLITVATRKMKEKFEKVYRDRVHCPLSINKFGLGVFDVIDSVSKIYTREELCAEFGIADSRRILVFVGHNGREAQRHFELTEQLGKLSEDVKKKIVLFYTMTYGVKNEKYLEDLKKLAEQSGCDYVVETKFMDENRIAKLRCISDVLLHAQLTDAFSASIQECLYTGSIVINGAWLPYDELPNYHDMVLEYDNVDEIVPVLEAVCRDYEAYKARFANNKQVLRMVSSREITTENWIHIIKNVQ